MYENKVAVIIRTDLLDWQKLNVVGFLASSIAIAFPQTHGKPFVNKSATYLPFLKHPLLIYGAQSKEEIMRTFKRAKERDLHIGIYTYPLFATKNEEENLSEIAKYTDDEQDLAGIILYGPNKVVDKAIDKLKFHA